MQKLVIYLHAEALDHPSWVILDEEGVVQHTVHHGSMAELVSYSANKMVILLVPTQDVLLTQVALPKMNRLRLRQAVPYALEEQLIPDLDSMHFALGEHVGDAWPVLAVSHEQMQRWLDLLQSHQIPIDIITPAVLALPLSVDAWQVYVADMALIRMQAYQGLTVELPQVAMLLQQAIDTAGQLPANIKLSNYSMATFASKVANIAIVETKLPAEQFVKDLAVHLDDNKLINLLQGPYAQKKAKRVTKNRSWQPLLYLAGAWLILLFAYPLVSYTFLKQRLNAIADQMLVVYRHQFPGATSMIAPKLRMEEKWQQLNLAAGQNRALLLLGYIGKGMQINKGIKLNRADFQNKQLTLDLVANSSEEMTVFSDYLVQQGLNVKQQNVNFAGAHVNATLQVE